MASPQLQNEYDRLYKQKECNDGDIYTPPVIEPEPVVWPWVVAAYVAYAIGLFAIFAYVAHA